MAPAAPAHPLTEFLGEPWAFPVGKTPVAHVGHGESAQTFASTAGTCARDEPEKERVLLLHRESSPKELHHHPVFCPSYQWGGGDGAEDVSLCSPVHLSSSM